MGNSPTKFDGGVWFSEAFLALAEEKTRLPSPAESAARPSAAQVRQVERIREQVQFDSSRAAAAAAATAERERQAEAARHAVLRGEAAHSAKFDALKREFAQRRAAELGDPRNAPFVPVPLLPFSNWRPSALAGHVSDRPSATAADAAAPAAVVVVVGQQPTAATAPALPAAPPALTTAPDPSLLAEVEALRARVAEMDALRARVEHMSLVDQGRALARAAARDAEAQLTVLAAAWRTAASAAQANDAKIAALEEAVARAEATLAAPALVRKAADAQCVDARQALLAQLHKADNDADAVARLVREYGRCVRS